MYMECSGEPSADWQRRLLTRWLIKFNQTTLNKLHHPDRYVQHPTLFNSTRRPLLPSITPETYIYELDLNCDPYHNPTIYDAEQLTFKQTINVPFQEFAKRTNTNLSTTGKHKHDTIRHATVHQGDEKHDTEITVLVALQPENIKTILKLRFNSTPTGFQSPQKLPVATNEIRAARTSFPWNSERPEHKYFQETAPKESNEAGYHPETTQKPTTPRTRRIKRALTRELSHTTQRNHRKDDTNANKKAQVTARQQGCGFAPHQRTTQLNRPHKPDLKQKLRPIFFSHHSEQDRKMLFAPMDFNILSLDTLIGSEALVNCLPESELEKIKSISPDNILKEMEPPTFKLQIAIDDIEAPSKTVQLQFDIGDWTFKEIFIGANKIRGPILGLTFLENNSTILDVTQALLHFPPPNLCNHSRWQRGSLSEP